MLQTVLITVFLALTVIEGVLLALLWVKRSAERVEAARQEEVVAQGQAALGRVEQQLQGAEGRLDEANGQLGEAKERVARLETTIQENEKAHEQRLADLNEARQGMVALATKSLKDSGESLLKPIHELLEIQGSAIGELEKKREGAYAKIEEQIRSLITGNEKLDQETSRLVSALRRPEQRGRWGEFQLRNTVEMAGMTKHCDFDEQVTMWTGERQQRPDMVIHMPGGGVIAVDSKVALDAYLDSIQPDADREEALKHHAKQVQDHYKSLASKQYWKQFERTPKFVVMFMPLESALVAALEVKPDLLSEAMQNHVLIVTPTLLVSLLLSAAYGWQQEDLAANARQISVTGRELYDRLATFVGHFERVGKEIGQAGRAYNSAVGSLERSILPSSRKLKELHATTSDEIVGPDQVEVEIRPFVSGELLAENPPSDVGRELTTEDTEDTEKI